MDQTSSRTLDAAGAPGKPRGPLIASSEPSRMLVVHDFQGFIGECRIISIIARSTIKSGENPRDHDIQQDRDLRQQQAGGPTAGRQPRRRARISAHAQPAEVAPCGGDGAFRCLGRPSSGAAYAGIPRDGSPHARHPQGKGHEHTRRGRWSYVGYPGNADRDRGPALGQSAGSRCRQAQTRPGPRVRRRADQHSRSRHEGGSFDL